MHAMASCISLPHSSLLIPFRSRRRSRQLDGQQQLADDGRPITSPPSASPCHTVSGWVTAPCRVDSAGGSLSGPSGMDSSEKPQLQRLAQIRPSQASLVVVTAPEKLHGSAPPCGCRAAGSFGSPWPGQMQPRVALLVPPTAANPSHGRRGYLRGLASAEPSPDGG